MMRVFRKSENSEHLKATFFSVVLCSTGLLHNLPCVYTFLCSFSYICYLLDKSHILLGPESIVFPPKA